MLPIKVGLLYGTDTSGLYEGVLRAPLETPSPLAEWFKQSEDDLVVLNFRGWEVLLFLAATGSVIAFPLPRAVRTCDHCSGPPLVCPGSPCSAGCTPSSSCSSSSAAS